MNNAIENSSTFASIKFQLLCWMNILISSGIDTKGLIYILLLICTGVFLVLFYIVYLTPSIESVILFSLPAIQDLSPAE